MRDVCGGWGGVSCVNDVVCNSACSDVALGYFRVVCAIGLLFVSVFLFYPNLYELCSSCLLGPLRAAAARRNGVRAARMAVRSSHVSCTKSLGRSSIAHEPRVPLHVLADYIGCRSGGIGSCIWAHHLMVALVEPVSCFTTQL